MNLAYSILLSLLYLDVIAGLSVIRPSSPRRGTSALFRSQCSRVTSRTVIERETVRPGGPAVLNRPEVDRKRRVDKPTREGEGRGNETWEVRIYNDGMNTKEHVARSLVQITGMTEVDAYRTMMHAHNHGIAVVGRWAYEVAEMYHDALRKNGIISDVILVDEGV